MGVGSTTFSFISTLIPQKLEYDSSDGEFKYLTNSKNVEGPIAHISIETPGFEYKTLPGITTIITDNGKNAILETKAPSIGRISQLDIQDIGFDYSVDKTLRPEANIPQLIKLDLLTSLKTIGITSVGKNYLESPGLVLLDGLTNKVVNDVVLDYELGDTQVSILRNKSRNKRECSRSYTH